MSLEDDLLTLREACEATGRSEMTLRKYLGLTKPPRPSKLPNARKILREGDTQETWAIPLSDLHNAGLMKGKKQKSSFSSGEELPNPAADHLALQVENLLLKKQIELLEANLADLRNEVAFHRRAIETKETQEARKKRFWER